MSKTLSRFQKDAEAKVFDEKHRRTIRFNMGKYEQAVQKGLHQYRDHELARSRASYIKQEAIARLDELLVQFEENITKRGAKVLWADTTRTALQYIAEIFEKHQAKEVVKSKSMATEEIGLNEFLEERQVHVYETDLGEFIVQLAGQKPYHIVTPAMHMSKEDISRLFSEKLHIEPTDDAQALTHAARRMLREKYVSAEVGITGANFIIADIGGIAITENEGNARLSVTFPKVHVAIVGLEKVLPRLEDLSLFWPLLATSGTGQHLTVYNSVITGPRQSKESDGPEEMYVILLDNGRTDLLADPAKRQALHCIRCGACLNACPVYKNIGGHTYGSTYSGPIGSVITPYLKGMKDYKHLSYASSLCGACSSVCPVKIEIHDLLLLNRKSAVEKKLVPLSERLAFKLWKEAMLNRRLMDMWGANIKNTVLRKVFKDSWGRYHTPIQVAPRSFKQLWQERIANAKKTKV